jgi:hypothetical protein
MSSVASVCSFGTVLPRFASFAVYAGWDEITQVRPEHPTHLARLIVCRAAALDSCG